MLASAYIFGSTAPPPAPPWSPSPPISSSFGLIVVISSVKSLVLKELYLDKAKGLLVIDVTFAINKSLSIAPSSNLFNVNPIVSSTKEEYDLVKIMQIVLLQIFDIACVKFLLTILLIVTDYF